MTSLIAARGIVKRFGRTVALGGVDLSVPEGQRIAVFGPNGSGKTTLLKVLAGLLRPTRGSVKIGGAELRRGGQALRRRIGVVSHHPYLYEDLTGEENLLFYGRMFGLDSLARRVEEALARAGVERRRRDKVGTYSRGMQQRLALARATLHDPDVLLLDEPDTGLDQEASAHIAAFLERGAGHSRTVVLATHDLGLGHAYCQRFLVLREGRVAWDGARDGLDVAALEHLYWSYATVH